MLRKLAVALVAASVFAAPVLAEDQRDRKPDPRSQADRRRPCDSHPKPRRPRTP